MIVDSESRTIRPTEPEGDAFYGLATGTNGTAAIARRACAEPSSTGGFRWVRYSGAPATGVYLVPTADSEIAHANPWIYGE